MDIHNNPLSEIDRVHNNLLIVCSTLEDIADHLPNGVSSPICSHASLTLSSNLALSHADHENGLFPLVEKYQPDNSGIQQSLERLRREHEEDSAFSDELSEVLAQLADRSTYLNHEAVGYMLRGFFESLRRHLAFKAEIIIPAVREKLSVPDRLNLAETMIGHRLAQL